eukprot:3666818-Rhodomonas_salina.3
MKPQGASGKSRCKTRHVPRCVEAKGAAAKACQTHFVSVRCRCGTDLEAASDSQQPRGCRACLRLGARRHGFASAFASHTLSLDRRSSSSPRRRETGNADTQLAAGHAGGKLRKDITKLTRTRGRSLLPRTATLSELGIWV